MYGSLSTHTHTCTVIYIHIYIYHIVEKISIKRNQTSLLISERSELDYLILSYKLHYWLCQNWLVKIIQIG